MIALLRYWKLILGVGGCLALFAWVNVERLKLADARNELADERTEAANYATQIAAAAAARAKAVSDAVEAERARTAALAASEREARAELEAQTKKAAADRRAADARIEVLLRENKEARDWAAVHMPDVWAAWVRGDLADAPGPAARNR